jgi:plastocyanin
MRSFLAGVLLGVLAGLAACAAPTPAPTPAPPTRPPAFTLTASPAPTDTTAPPTAAASATVAPATAILTATFTPAVTDTPAPSDTPAASATPAATRTPARAFITYQDFVILPAVSTIKAGTPVTFLIRAGLFTFHQPYNFTAPNVFEAPANLGDGAAYSYTFNEPGAVTLLCGYHADMRATLVIEP